MNRRSAPDTKKRPKAVGTAAFTAGSRTHGELLLAEDINVPVAAPVMIVTGRNPGPTLWVQAAIHGTEVGGSIGIMRAFDRLDPEQMSGAIVGIMATNPLAFRAQTYQTAQDGVNMNRAFPGTLAGSITFQMASRLMAAAEATADAVVDFHSGGLNGQVPFYAYYWEDESATARLAESYARSAATKAIWRSKDAWFKGAMVVELTKRQTPGILVECGGGGEITDEHVENFAATVEGVARAMGILPGGAVKQEKYRVVGNCDPLFAGKAGFFIPECAPGDELAAGATVGTIIDVFGNKLETLVSPKAAYISAIMRRFLPVHSGVMLAELNDLIGWE